jgi:hypothetical protein
MARYVMRLSIALGDLRIAGHFVTRKRQSTAERLYFLRLTASHMRELVLIMEPPNTQIVPTVREFVRALPRDAQPSSAEILKSHVRAMALLDQPMHPDRPPITVNEQQRRPKLRDDLKELRNRFLHYGHDAPGDAALRAAMDARRGGATGYVIREVTMRALYADDVGMTLTHPFPPEFAEEMHTRLVAFLQPATLFVHQVEAAWLHAHRDVVVVRTPGQPPRALREFFDH